MENQTYNLGHDREWDRRRELQQAVLLPLTEIWDLLAASKHMTVESDGTTTGSSLSRSA